MAGAIDQIEHIVVLMFENRSFDHLFGDFPGANGLFAEDGGFKPEAYNLDHPTQPAGPLNQVHQPIAITPDVQLDHDFFHDFIGMMPELFGPGATGWAKGEPLGVAGPTTPLTNSGFYSTVAYNVGENGQTINGPQSLSYYEHGSLKVLHRLAEEFVLCDNWFCDVPGDTLLNRYFMHAAQSGGELADNQGQVLVAPTIFDRIEACNSTWKMYAPFAIVDRKLDGNTQVDSRLLSPNIRDSPFTHLPVTEFASDLAGGTLPFYSFLMCWLPPETWHHPSRETSMHPASDIRSGENYLAAVYNALRASPYWDKTLLIITFDENGGLYDHVMPPAVVAPDAQTGSVWDPYRGLECSFDFTLLGPRIPAILVSPWLASGVASGQYQNTSILRTLREKIGAPQLTERDGAAPSLDGVFAEFGLEQPRTDCPETLSGYDDFPYSDGDLSKTYVALLDDVAGPMPDYLVDVARAYGNA